MAAGSNEGPPRIFACIVAHKWWLCATLVWLFGGTEQLSGLHLTGEFLVSIQLQLIRSIHNCMHSPTPRLVKIVRFNDRTEWMRYVEIDGKLASINNRLAGDFHFLCWKRPNNQRIYVLSFPKSIYTCWKCCDAFFRQSYV